MRNPIPSPFRRGASEQRFTRQDLPETLAGFIWKVSAWDQFWLCLISVAVSLLDTAPIEIQRRIIDKTVYSGDFAAIVFLAGIYVAIVVGEGLVKLLMNLYRGWVAEHAVRILRGSVTLIADDLGPERMTADQRGTEAAMIVSEVEPVGGFAGDSLSEPLLQGGILVSVFGYLTWLNPFMAGVALAVFSPQFFFVPIMQRAINQRVKKRIATLRIASSNVLDQHIASMRMSQEARFEDVFRLNMGIYEFKYTLNFLMNLTLNFGTVVILTLGGWFVVKGSADVGTMVAFVTGLRSVSSPWGSLVTWFQTAWVTAARYDLLQATVRQPSGPVE